MDIRNSDGHRTKVGDWLVNNLPFLKVWKSPDGSMIYLLRWQIVGSHASLRDIARFDRGKYGLRLRLCHRIVVWTGESWGIANPKRITRRFGYGR